MMVVVVTVLVAVNVLNNRVAPRAYLATSVIATGVLLLLLPTAGLTWADAGLAPDAARRGALWGLAAAVLVAGFLVIAALLPASRGVFLDRRVAGVDGKEAAYQTLVRIPVATVMLEEVAFRGVLYGAVLVDHGAVWASLVSSVLFGFWHVLPSLRLNELNVAAGRAFGTRRALLVAVAVVTSALAGLVLCELRRRSGSLLAPVGLHWAANALGYLTAFLVTRHRAPGR